ncbi:MAG: hypothetical protein MZU84_08025 [Sphingobacterium sp.]|nr:hypothetical protein [Sphingobacterium sp.]
MIFIILIILYTLKGGIQNNNLDRYASDNFHAACSYYCRYIYISRELDISLVRPYSRQSRNSDISKMFITDWHHERFFLKQFFSGMFITIVMTGLDQEMMQKNLSCRNIQRGTEEYVHFQRHTCICKPSFPFPWSASVIFIHRARVLWLHQADDIFPTVALEIP